MGRKRHSCECGYEDRWRAERKRSDKLAARVEALTREVRALGECPTSVGRQVLVLLEALHEAQAEIERLQSPRLRRNDPLFAGERRPRYRKAVRQAWARRKPWNLTPEEFFALAEQPCVFCGGPTGTGIGLDRIDESRGYEPDNVQPCCGPCNIEKKRRGKSFSPRVA